MEMVTVETVMELLKRFCLCFFLLVQSKLVGYCLFCWTRSSTSSCCFGFGFYTGEADAMILVYSILLATVETVGDLLHVLSGGFVSKLEAAMTLVCWVL